MNNFKNHHCVQFGIWSDCCNNCKFCLRQDRRTTNKKSKLKNIERVYKNIDYIDWENKFSYGISLLGGEIYYVKDKEIQEAYLKLVDKIIDKILKVSKNPYCRYSTVTNGLYDPTFLYKVVDRIRDAVGIDKVDINFSYDLKYRYDSEEKRLLALKNINDFKKRYNYGVGVQMILTQYVIDMWKEGKFDVNKFLKEDIPGCNLSFLYPHPIHTGIKLDDFNFKRKDLINFVRYLRDDVPQVYGNFIYSTLNSGTFKYTGYRDRSGVPGEEKQQPVLSDGKEIINPNCGHSRLYQCYADSNACMLCDLKLIDGEL